MAQIPYVFNQLCAQLDRDRFEYLVVSHNGDWHVHHYTCWNHLKVMLWAQLTCRRSLRDIEYSLKCHLSKLYRMGMGKSVSRNSIAHANDMRQVAIFREMAQHMMNKASKLPACDRELIEIAEKFEITGFFAVDSTTVLIPLSQAPWSVSQNGYGGIKLHTLFSLLCQVPIMALITGHEERDQTFMDDYPYAKGALYMLDKAYVKVASLYKIHKQAEAYFVVRRKENMVYQVVSDNALDESDKCVMRDCMIVFTSRWAKQGYPEKLRLVQYYSQEKGELLEFLTNNTELSPSLVAYAYKRRWDIELFFRWVKQHLNISHFYGTSGNAVMIQIYTAVIAFCMLALAAKDCKFPGSIYEFSRFVSTSLTEKRWLEDMVQEVDKMFIDSKIEDGSMEIQFEY